MIIVCGADNTGKSVLVDKLVKRFNLSKLKRYDPLPPTDGRDYFTWGMKRIAWKPETRDDTIVDRFLIGEYVYGPIVRSKNMLLPYHGKIMEGFNLVKPLFICCQPPIEVVLGNYGDREQYVDESYTRTIMKTYPSVLNDWLGEIPNAQVYYHDYSSDHAYLQVYAVVKKYLSALKKAAKTGEFKMNVEDVINTREYSEKWLADCYDAQEILAHKYMPIEKANGLLETEDVPVDLDDKNGQARLKNMFWRVTEEIAEAMDAWVNNEEVHMKEEVADAFHFLLEAAILSGIGKPELKVAVAEEMVNLGIKLDYDDVLHHFIREFGMAANCLKNKPWKQTHIKTDKHKYNNHFLKAFGLFVFLADSFGLTSKVLFDFYFRKNQVNQFRQRSNY